MTFSRRPRTSPAISAIPGRVLAHDDIAGQQRADLGLRDQGTVGERRVARAQDAVARKIDVELLLHRRRNVDLGEDAEALFGKLLGDAFQRRVEAQVDVLSEAVAGGHGGFPWNAEVESVLRPCGARCAGPAGVTP
jgi:hypothetical protein